MSNAAEELKKSARGAISWHSCLLEKCPRRWLDQHSQSHWPGCGEAVNRLVANKGRGRRLSPWMGSVGNDCMPVHSSAHQLTNTLLGRELLKHTSWLPRSQLTQPCLLQFPQSKVTLAPALCRRPLGRAACPFIPPSLCPVISRRHLPGERRGRGHRWCHSSRWPGSSLDNTSHHPPHPLTSSRMDM